LNEALKKAMSDTLSDGVGSLFATNKGELREIGCYLIGWFRGSLRRHLDEQVQTPSLIKQAIDYSPLTNKEPDEVWKKNRSYKGLTLNQILRDIDRAIPLAQTDGTFASHLIKELKAQRAILGWDLAEVIINLPDQYLLPLLKNPKWKSKMNKGYKDLHASFYECQEVQDLWKRLNIPIVKNATIS
jgi:hypothetical protein